MAPWALFSIALAVRLVALAVAHTAGRFPEHWEPDTIARNLLAGRGFVYHHMGIDRFAYYEPVYPFVVAAVYLVAGINAWALALVHATASAILAPATYAYAARTFGTHAAVAAGALVAINPAFAGYATTFHPVTFDALALLLVALALLRLLQAPGARRALALGVASGLCILTRPTVIAFLAAAIAWLAIERRRRAAVPYVAAALAVAAVVVAPWVVRNYLRLDGFVLTRSHVGFGFWLGNHPGAPGGEGDPSDRSAARSAFDRAAPELRARVLAARDELERDRILRDEAVRYVAREPVAFVGRTLRKLGYFVWLAPYVGARYPPGVTAVYTVFWSIVLALAIAGAWLAWRRPVSGQADGVAVALLFVASIAVAQALFYVQGRHRLGIEAVVLLFSGRALSALPVRSTRAP